jgi:hypothetical protein
MNPAIPGAPLADAERARLDRIRKEIADGTYHISAYDVAVKLIRSMFEFDDLPSLHRPFSSSEGEVEVKPLDQKRG